MHALHQALPPAQVSALTDGPPDAALSSAATNMTHRQPPPASAPLPTPDAPVLNPSSKPSSSANSLNHSPLASRDSSPTRRPRHSASTLPLTSPGPSHDTTCRHLSPTRQTHGRTVNSTSLLPTLASNTAAAFLPPPASDLSHTQDPTPPKPMPAPDPKDPPRWPVSPRLRSPPPQVAKSAASLARRGDQEPPKISLQQATPSPQPTNTTPASAEAGGRDDSPLRSTRSAPSRAGPGSSQEIGKPDMPLSLVGPFSVDQMSEKREFPDNRSDSAPADAGRDPTSKPSPTAEQLAADPAAHKTESRRTASVPPPPLITRQTSAMSAKQPNKSKTEGSTQNMTVETETVLSLPQVAVATGTKPEGSNGTLKPKPSTETIKPKKEKKKFVRKQPAVHSGTASSKADIFEAKIASAVDEANTSDSEETFVYDSNPPDTADRSNRRFHSRTPSATSMASQADRQNLRSIYGVMESGPHALAHVHPPGHGPVPKKSMKFVNICAGNASDNLAPGDEEGKGTGRSAGGSSRGTVRHHHHIGRWGRQMGNGHASLFDNESPFPNAAKSKLSANNSRNSSGPPSPRSYHSARGHLASKRSTMQMSSSYDLDDTTGADDERAPLLHTSRSYRGGRTRRGPHNLRQTESQNYSRRNSYLNRFAACLVLTMMFLLVITGAIGFMFATSQPLTGIEIVSISNVVTSEQVLMYDLTVKAHNPNIVVVTIDDANLEIFAKSDHGDGWDWWKMVPGLGDGHKSRRRSAERRQLPGDDGGDDSDSRPNILLGRVTKFDSPLTFEGSIFHRGTSSSTGEMQLAYPGNNTEGGSRRWERIYENEFDLIVKGVVKYRLPLSAHVRSATVSGRTTVKPNSANDPSLEPNSTLLHEA